MRITFIILGIISAIIALILSILPFGLIALIPAVIAFALGLLALSASKKEGKSKLPVNLIFLLTVAALAITTYRSVTNENTVEADTEFIEKEKASEENAIDELEGIEGINESSGD